MIDWNLYITESFLHQIQPIVSKISVEANKLPSYYKVKHILFQNVAAASKTHKLGIDLRTAAYITSIEKIFVTYDEHGLAF